MKSDGRILIAGLCKGDLLVEKNTVSGSLIRAVTGLAAGATVQINTEQDESDAYGTIHFGNPDLEVQDSVTFDGCIRIFDEDESGNTGDYGNLSGEIVVNGCHGTQDEMIICVDGNAPASAFNVIQDGCGTVIPYPEYECTSCP